MASLFGGGYDVAAFPHRREAIQDRSSRINGGADEVSILDSITQLGDIGSPRHIADGRDSVREEKWKVGVAFHKVHVHVGKSRQEEKPVTFYALCFSWHVNNIAGTELKDVFTLNQHDLVGQNAA